MQKYLLDNILQQLFLVSANSFQQTWNSLLIRNVYSLSRGNGKVLWFYQLKQAARHFYYRTLSREPEPVSEISTKITSASHFIADFSTFKLASCPLFSDSAWVSGSSYLSISFSSSLNCCAAASISLLICSVFENKSRFSCSKLL